MTGRPESVSLYFHIPFCTKKCPYCHFFVLPDRAEHRAQFLKALQQEWNLRSEMLLNKEVVSIYFGGGTPSLLNPKEIQQILSWIRADTCISPKAEITLEVNPETVSDERMRSFRETGINRISIGIQSLDDPLLQQLGRTHSAQTAIDAVNRSHSAGFDNITVDLMMDLPTQTMKTWVDTLDRVTNLPITHLSLYNLVIEPHTIFFKKENDLRPLMPSDEVGRRMLEIAHEKFELAGLQRYEISAFAKPGMEAVHNSGYWTGRPFLGLGPSAFSYWNGHRFRNHSHLGKYCKDTAGGIFPIEFDEELDPAAKIREQLVIGLRLVQGVSLDAFDIEKATLSTLEKLEEQKWLKKSDGRVCLTEEGRFYYDSIAVELI